MVAARSIATRSQQPMNAITALIARGHPMVLHFGAWSGSAGYVPPES